MLSPEVERLMGDVVPFKSKKKPDDGKVTILLGGKAGSICPHCHDVLYHAMVMPQGVHGKACRACDIWFDGIDDLYR